MEDLADQKEGHGLHLQDAVALVAVREKGDLEAGKDEGQGHVTDVEDSEKEKSVTAPHFYGIFLQHLHLYISIIKQTVLTLLSLVHSLKL